MMHFISERLLIDPKTGRSQTVEEWSREFASRIKKAARIAKAKDLPSRQLAESRRYLDEALRPLSTATHMAIYHRDREKWHRNYADFLRKHDGAYSSGKFVKAPRSLSLMPHPYEGSPYGWTSASHYFHPEMNWKDAIKLHDTAADAHAVARDAHLEGHKMASYMTDQAKEASKATTVSPVEDWTSGYRSTALGNHQLLTDGRHISDVKQEVQKSLHKAEGEPGEFRGGDPEEIRLKKEEKQAELGEMGDSGEDQSGEEPDPADVEEAQQEEADKEAEKGLGILSQPLAGMEVSPWPPNTTDYPSKDRNGFGVDSSEFHYFRGHKQPWVEVGPPRQGPNQKKPWSEVLGLPPAMAPSGPPYWRQLLRMERREELGLNPRPNPYAAQPVSKAFDDLLKASKILSWKSAKARAGAPSLPHYRKPLGSRLSLHDLDSMPEHVEAHVKSVLGKDWRSDLHKYSKEIASDTAEPTESPIKRAVGQWIDGSHRFPFIRGAGQAVLTHDKEALSHLSKIKHDSTTRKEHTAGVAAGVLSRMPLHRETVEHHAGGPVTHLYRESYYVPKGAKVGDHVHLAAPTSFSHSSHWLHGSDASSIMKMKLPSRGFSLGNQSGSMGEVLVSGHFRVSKISKTPDGKVMYHVEEHKHEPVSKAIGQESIWDGFFDLVKGKQESDPGRVVRLPGGGSTWEFADAPTARKPILSHRKGLVPCPYGGGIECMRHGGDGAKAHRPSYHHEHEGQPLSHVDLLHQEAEKSSGERTHALDHDDQLALVGHAMGQHENDDLDNPDTRSKYMKTLRHVHGYLGTDSQSNAWRRKAVSEWHRIADQYHAPDDRPEGHVAMESAKGQVEVTAKVGYQTVNSKDSDIPEHLLEAAFGKKIGIKDFQAAYRVDSANLKLPTEGGRYEANVHSIHINELGRDRYEVVVKGIINYHDKSIASVVSSKGETAPGTEKAASFSRSFMCDAGYRKPGNKGKNHVSVHHATLFVVGKGGYINAAGDYVPQSQVGGHQDAGLGTDFLRHSVEQYPKFGVTEITTHPHWVGKYTWAKMGFEWKSEDAPHEVLGLLPVFLMSHYGLSKGVAVRLAKKVADSPFKIACLKRKGARLTDSGEKLFHSFDKGHYRCHPDEVGKAFLLSDFGDHAWMGEGRVDMSKPTSPSYQQLRDYLRLK